ncbi:MAG: diguanylate cyclase [Acidobacteriota bacterium]
MGTETQARQNAKAIYAEEESLAEEASRVAEDATVTFETLREHYRFLAQKYRHAIRQLVKLTHVSDMFQGRLLRVQEELERRNAELELARTHLEQANQALHRLSYLDALTGLANRRRFNEYLEHEWRRAVRKQETLSLILLDVDYFKRINDIEGHQYGDNCLQQIGATLAASVRRTGDLAARYGGEEFAVILPDAQPKWVLIFAEEVRQKIVGLAIPHPVSPYGVVTISVGVAMAVATDSQGVSLLIAAADRALYAAKEAGRNRVSLAPVLVASDE